MRTTTLHGLIRTSGGPEVSTEVLSPSQEKSTHPFPPPFDSSFIRYPRNLQNKPQETAWQIRDLPNALSLPTTPG